MINLHKHLALKRENLMLPAFTLLIIILIILESQIALALPPLPTEFYGRIRNYNMNASAGEIVQAYDSDGTLCGSFTVVNSGFYGSLTCRADDPETVEDEGFTPGENIVFRYRSAYVTVMGNNTAGYGVFRYANLTYPVVYCGDYFCDLWYENYVNCPWDCPSVNATYNYTYNQSNGTATGGNEEDEGGGGRDTRNPVGLNPNYYLNLTDTNLSELEGYGFGCEEDWSCSNWSVCRIDEFQNRTCIDRAECDTYENKPAELQKCVYTPTCFDGVKNGLEEGIDCGGLCQPCINCFDGIQNCHDGACEEGIDCGGPCARCATCFDGFENCHDGACEEGIDCSGPCEKKCPEAQQPFFELTCKKDFNPISNQSVFFFMILLIIILVDMIYSRSKIREIGKNKALGDIKRARQILSVKRRMYLFIFITLLISVLLYLYYYFFIMCEAGYPFLWLLLVILFVSPLLIHMIIRYLEYTEDKRLRKIDALLNTHYKQIQNLIKIENENLTELEEELADDLYRLLDRPEYKENSSLTEVRCLKEIYKELIFLYSKYKEKENPVGHEKILCDDIYKLVEDEKYKYLIQSDSNLKIIVNKMKILYKQYEEKQKLYDEIGKIESSKEELKYELKHKDD